VSLVLSKSSVCWLPTVNQIIVLMYRLVDTHNKSALCTGVRQIQLEHGNSLSEPPNRKRCGFASDHKRGHSQQSNRQLWFSPTVLPSCLQSSDGNAMHSASLCEGVENKTSYPRSCVSVHTVSIDLRQVELCRVLCRPSSADCVLKPTSKVPVARDCVHVSVARVA
jgi:hypothetical protein